MLKFLYEQKELSNPRDTILTDLDVMYDRLILQTKRSAKPAKIYLFGTNSPHGKRFIELNDHTGTAFLTAIDLPADMKVILNFFRRNNINSQVLYQSLATIAETYQYNLKRNFRPAIEEK